MRISSVERDGFAEFLFRLQRKSLREQFVASADMEAGMAVPVGLGKPLLSNCLDLPGQLPEGVFIIVPLDALDRYPVRCVRKCLGGCLHCGVTAYAFINGFCFGITGSQSNSFPKLL